MPRKRKLLNSLLKKLKALVKRKPSTVTQKGSSVSYQHQQSGTPSSYSLHRSIRTLTYDSFIRIITGEDLGLLIIEGQPPVDELVSAWDHISEEYTEAIKTNNGKGVLKAYLKFTKLQAQMKMIDASIFYLTNAYDEEIANNLFENGYPLVEPNDNRETYLKQIDRVRIKAGTLVVMLNQAAAAYKLLAPDNEMKVERSYQNFLDELAILSKHQGGALIKAKDITVAEYCSVVNSYIAYVEANKKNKNG